MNKIPATILRPALHTLWQSFTAALLVWWGVAGTTGWHSVTDVSSAGRFGLSALIAGIAALASALLHVAREYGPALARAEFHDNPRAVEMIEAAFTQSGVIE